MRGEEDVQNLLKADDVAVETDVDDFSMAGRLGADLLISWIVDMSAHVAGYSRFDADQLNEYSFHAPKAPAA